MDKEKESYPNPYFISVAFLAFIIPKVVVFQAYEWKLLKEQQEQQLVQYSTYNIPSTNILIVLLETYKY